ncbi:MAG TPA: hypothetical protein VF316_11805, partial [Polyangiaceae bacterium]
VQLPEALLQLVDVGLASARGPGRLEDGVEQLFGPERCHAEARPQLGRADAEAIRTDAWVYDSGYGAPGVALRQGSDPVAGPLVDAIVLAAVLGRRDVLADFVAGREIPVPGVLARDP